MNELNTLRQVYNDGLRLRMTAPVDDDFSEMMHNFDCSLRDAKEVINKGFDLASHLTNQIEWSRKTFGPGDRRNGIVEHIGKELNEILESSGDLEEWIDVVILALDGAWRAGNSPEQIIKALVSKQAKNEGRNWPDWRTIGADKAIEHIGS